MRVSHSPASLSAIFDDPNLVSCGGLAPVMSAVSRSRCPDCGRTHVL